MFSFCRNELLQTPLLQPPARSISKTDVSRVQFAAEQIFCQQVGGS